MDNGWLEVLDILPLMKPAYLNETYPFVYLDVGCKLGEETTFVLKNFPGAQVVALEMRAEFAKKCEANSLKLAADERQVVVLNKAAAMSVGSGVFKVSGDASSISKDERGGAGGVPIEFVTLDSVWEKHIAPKKASVSPATPLKNPS